MKKSLFYVVFIVINAIFILFQIFKYDLLILAKSNSFGYQIILGLLDNAMYLLYALIFLFSVIYAVVKMKEMKWKAYVHSIVCVLVIFLLIVLPATESYANWNYSLNKSRRTSIIEMKMNGELTEFAIGMNEYRAPYRGVSYTKAIYVQEKANTTKIMFIIHQAFGINRVLIYVSDDSGIDVNDFALSSYPRNYCDIKKMDTNWYLALVDGL